MSDQPIEIPINLDAQGFVSGAGKVTDASSDLQQSFRGLTVQTASVQKVFDAVTPGRATLGALGAFAAMSANVQQRMSNLQATSTVTGVRVDKLGGSIRQMARDMPLGAKTTQGVVEQFTQMGVAAVGSEKKIASLSKSVLRLSGATGEGPNQLADGMTNLARATGNASLDPKRFEALGDSLTTVSKMSGASASSILAFSKNIAPMANAAGIGATGVLGISSAFARLGEDGFGASTAVNKMLTDMSRSVREGGPQMRNYAEIVGKSADEFERLFKANPTEALTQVTEAIANAGDRGPRLLEQIGVEGVRGQRALQALSASGGLRTAVAQATTGYGSGSTSEAAQAAFGGLNDSLIELKETSQQLGEAMGAPLLTPLTRFTELLKQPLSLASRAAGSGAGQGVLTAAAYGAIAFMATRAVVGPLTALGLGRQALTSTPLRALAAGVAQGRGMGPESRLSRFGAPIMNAGAEGRMGTWAGRFLNFGRDMGVGMGPAAAGGAGTLGQRLLGGVSSAAQLNWNMATGSLYNGSINDPTRRMPLGMNAGQAWQGGLAEMRQAFRPGGGGLSAGLTSFNARLLEAGRGANAFGRTTLALARVPLASAAVGARLGGDVARMGAGALRGIGGMLGPTALLTGGVTALMMGRSNQAAQRQEIVDRGQMDIRGTINTYRESIGVATQATVQLGSQMDQLAKSVALTTTSMSDARRVTQRDISIATSGNRKVQTNFAGTNAQVAAQVEALDVNGLSPRELQAVKTDLLRSGRGAGSVERILGMVGTGGSRGSGAAGLRAAVAGADSSERGGIMGFLARGNSESGFLSRPGGLFHVNSLGEGAKDQTNVIIGNIAQRYAAQTDRFGVGYARQEQARGMNAAIGAAMKAGNADLVEQLGKTFSQQITGKQGGVQLSMQDIRDSGGFMQALMATNRSARREYGDVALSGPGVAATRQRGYFADQMAAAGESQFAGFYDQRSRGPVGRAVQQALATPEDAAAFSKAVDMMTDAAHRSGKGFDQVAISALNSAKNLSADSAAYALQRGVQAKAEQQMQFGQTAMSPGQRLAQNLSFYGQLAQTAPVDEARAGERQRGIAGSQQTLSQMQEALAGRLQMQRQYETANKRAWQDFNLAQTYAEEDYLRARGRAQKNFTIQLGRMREDAAKTLYNPYDRIATQPTWDTQNLLVNAKEQTEAMERQTRQLRQLRRAGVSRQTIDQLELYKTENAQQLNTMTGDLMNDPRLVARLNQSAARRGRAAGALSQDPSNTDTRRMREDFRRSMDYMASDMDRMRTRQQHAFDVSVGRMKQDMHRAGQAIAGDAETLATEVNRALHGKAVHWAKLVVSDTQVIIDAIKNDMAPNLKAALDEVTAAGSGWTGANSGPAFGYDMADASMATRANAGGTVSRAQGQGMATAGSSTSVTHTGQVTYDQRNDFTGANVTVQSADPDDMAKKTAAKARQSALTKTRGVSWSTTL